MFFKIITLPFLFVLFLSGCTSYSITEQEITDYLAPKMNIDHSIGQPNFLLYANIHVEDIKVTIGRIDKNRLTLFARTYSEVQVGTEKQSLNLELEFSAIPYYDHNKGAIYIKALRLEKFEDEQNRLSPQLKSFLKPTISIIGRTLANVPVYELNENNITERLLKSAQPDLIIKNNEIIIEL